MVATALLAFALPAQQRAPTPRVGPPKGSVIVVGGGSLGPEIYAKFIELAGGPDALIVDVPTAGGDSVYPADWRGAQPWRAAGARHVVVLHTIDRKVADSDEFVEPLKHAGGVWFEGGRQFHLVDAYAGTKTETEFNNVLARGGVAGGSSAGASILGSFLVRGAPSNNNFIIDYPGYETGFGFLRGVGIDQHVVARERLRDLADSLMPKHPELLGISEDEGTAWVVRGDSAEIIGRNKAFVYGGHDPTDPGKPFLTLHPGDRYDLASRHVTHRAIDDTPLRRAFIDSLFGTFAPMGTPMATVLVAEDGQVLVDRSYGIPDQPKYMPTTTVPNFPLGGLSCGFNAMAAALVVHDGKIDYGDPLADGGGLTLRQYLSDGCGQPDGGSQLVALLTRNGGTPYAQLVSRRLYTPIGAHKTSVGSDGQFQSNVDELYRWSLGLQNARTFVRDTSRAGDSSTETASPDQDLGWRSDSFRRLARLAEYGTADGKRNALVRFPDRRVTIIVLTDSDTTDARGIAERIAVRLLLAGGATRGSP
jgi:cyanophycinase